MPIDLRPPALAFDASGAPFSTTFGDVYHSRDSGPGQAQHVFLHGNDLPARWKQAPVFTIVETGFGTGLNFLVTWAAWRDDPQRCARLHFVSIERHPFRREDLQRLHAQHPQLAGLAAQLQSAWPPALPGLHRLHFEGGGVTLTLVLADVETAARDLHLGADAFYLDGFAPDRNPRMWSVTLMKALARLAVPGATFATYTSARSVRDALATAGFLCERRPGFGTKWHMLAGRYAPSWQTRHRPPIVPRWPERHAIVIGAGLAGAAVARSLATRHWRVDVIEHAATPASAASGLHAGVFQPHVSIDDGILSRAARAGLLHALNAWRELEHEGKRFCWAETGALSLAADGARELQMTRAVEALGFNETFVRGVSREEACQLAGARVAHGGWWFPSAGWMRSPSLVRAQLAGANLKDGLHLRRGAASLRRADDTWEVLDNEGAIIAYAPVVVLANAHDAARLADCGPTALRAVRGQLSYVPVPPFRAPRCVVGGDGYVLPSIDGTAVIGASFDRDDANPHPDDRTRDDNLARAERLLPGCTRDVDVSAIDGAVAFRCATVDRLPLVGRVVDRAALLAGAATLSGTRTRDLPRMPGLYAAFGYGSRGLIWASLAAEVLACELDGEPAPLERSLLDAVDPGRFAMKQLRRKTL